MATEAQHPVTVRCVFCASGRTGGETATLAALRGRRRTHATAGRPAAELFDVGDEIEFRRGR